MLGEPNNATYFAWQARNRFRYKLATRLYTVNRSIDVVRSSITPTLENLTLSSNRLEHTKNICEPLQMLLLPLRHQPPLLFPSLCLLNFPTSSPPTPPFSTLMPICSPSLGSPAPPTPEAFYFYASIPCLDPPTPSFSPSLRFYFPNSSTSMHPPSPCLDPLTHPLPFF